MATSNLRFRIIGDDDASGAFLRVAAAARLTKGTFDDLNESGLGLTKLIGGTALAPLVAGTTAALGGLAGSLTAGAGATGIFGASVFGVAKQMIDQQKEITKLKDKLDGLDKGSQEYKDTLKELRGQQDLFKESFGPAATGFLNMKDAFAGFVESTKSHTVDVLGKGMNLLADILPKLVPVSNAAADAFGTLIDDMSAWTKSSSFTGLLDWFETTGSNAIVHWGHAVGNTLVALGHLLGNFTDPSDKAGASLERITGRFATWAGSKGVSDSVDSFLKYVHDNGPTIASTLSSMAEVFPKLASSLGGLGSANLAAISLFLNLLAKMPQGVFDVVVTGLFGIAAASKAVSLAAGIQTLMVGASTAITALGDACIGTRLGLIALAIQEKATAVVTGIWTGAQWLLNAALTANPIGIVVVALAALGAALVIAYNKSDKFREVVNAAWDKVKQVTSEVFDKIVGWVRDLPDKITNGLSSLRDKVTGVFRDAWGSAKDKAQDIGGNILQWVNGFPDAVQNRLGDLAAKVRGIFDDAMTAGKDKVTGIGGTILDWIRGIPGKIGELGGQMAAAGRGLLQDFIDGMKNAGGIIEGIASNVWNAVRSLLNGAIDKINAALVFTISLPGPDIHVDLPNIPHLATGGVVTSPTVALIGEAGPEAVVPLSSPYARAAGFGGGDMGTIVVVVQTDTGEEIQRKLLTVKQLKGGVSLGLA